MMEDSRRTHWGEWIEARSRHVGFRRQVDLAKAVGCSRERIVRWFVMERPPEKMRKGFDQTLAAALKVDKAVLLTDYRRLSPNEVPLQNAPNASDPSETDALRRKITAVAELLPADKLREFYGAGNRILHSQPAGAA